MSLPLVLLPGMMCDARLYAPQVEAFGSDRPVHVLPVTAHETMGELAAEVLASAPDRFALAGLSMGGIVAMEVFRRAPGRVVGLALLDTNPKAEADAIKAARGAQMDKAKAGQLQSVMRDEMKPNYLAEGPDRQRILDLCMAMALDLGPEVFIRQSKALRDRPDQQDTLKAVTVPTLVVCGREDRLCPIHRHELMHSLMPHSVLEIIDGAGHLPTLEQPESTNRALARWLEACDG